MNLKSEIIEDIPEDIKNEEKEKDDEKKKLNSVGVIELFAFADKWDVFLIIMGLIGAVIAGAIFPIMFAIFGNITDGFTNYQVQHNLTQCDNFCFDNATDERKTICK